MVQDDKISNGMQSVGKILKNFNPEKDKYISRDFQAFGIYMAEQMDDYAHRSMYIRLAKVNHRSVLEAALSFVKDSTAENKIGLFLWKLKQIKNQTTNLKSQITTDKSKISKK